MARQTRKDTRALSEILSDYREDSKVQEMKNYTQHGKVSTYEHCENVARLSYAIDRKFSLKSDLDVLLVGAMLHDFYDYDWHDPEHEAHRLHGFTHPRVASENAREHFDVDERTSRVIDRHMWPLTPAKIPRSREEWIVCIVDKCVSLHETIFRRRTPWT